MMTNNNNNNNNNGGGGGSTSSTYFNDRGFRGESSKAYGADPATGSFFHSDYKKHEDLKQMLDSNKDGLKLEAMKRIIGMVAKGRDASELFPAVVKNVVSKNIEVKKLVYVYLVRYAEEQQDLALLSISTFQRALKDPNQLIRASALRVLSSIRVPVIVPIVMLAIKDSASDMSPYVRKTAAHAIPKIYSLDPDQKEELVHIIEKLLSDKMTLVVGSAVMAFEEVCPERIDLIHKNYRKLCNLLVDVDEWGQVLIINMLTRYAKTQFDDPNKHEGAEDGENRPFYDEEEEDEREEKKFILDPDYRLLLRSAKPLLQSRNAAVVMAVASLYHHIAPRSEVNIVSKSLIRLLRSHREVQSVVLNCIASISTQRKGMFEPYLKSFFVRTSDATHIKLLKLEIMTNLATETNISVILREFQTYIASQDKEFVAATIEAIGRCASNIKEVNETCLTGLVALLSNRDSTVVAESVVVVKKLLQTQPNEHKDIIIHLAKLIESITVPQARASILWLLGEYSERVPRIAPDVLRKMAKVFIHQEDLVKLQIVNLAVKLYLTNPAQTKLLAQYVLNLAKYDQNYDIRDRVRFMRNLLFPSANSEGSTGRLAKHAKRIFMASKPAPVLESKFKDRDQFQLGSMSHYINARSAGYQDLPDFPEAPPDATVRDVESAVVWEEVRAIKKQQASKKRSFYSESESADESEDESKSDSDESDSETATETSDETEKESDSKESSDETESGESDSDSESESSEESAEEPAEAPASKTPTKSNLDLLLELDDVLPQSIATPVLTPSLGGLLTPMGTAAMPGTATATIRSVNPAFVPTKTRDLVDKVSGSGLQIQHRFTRSPHLYSPSMVSVELTFVNNGEEDMSEVKVGQKHLRPEMSMHEFATISKLPAGATLSGTIGVDFCDTTQPASFEIVAGGRSVRVELKAPVGEQIHPVSMSEAIFMQEQGKLRGMNENCANIKLPGGTDMNAVCQRVYEAANVNQVPAVDISSTLRFSGQTLSSKCLVLITVQLSQNGEDSRVVVNCEKMVICSMLLNELKQALSK